jgi:hypothetical protein
MPTSLVLQTGQVVQVPVDLINQNGQVNNSMPGITYSWFASGGSISPPTGTGRPVATYTAPSSSGSFTIDLEVKQDGVTICKWDMTAPSRKTQANVAVQAPAPTPTPTPPVVNPPGPVPTIVPQTPGATLSVVTPAQGGTLAPPSIPGLEITVPAGAVNNYAGVQVVPVDLSKVPAPPAGAFKVGSTVVDIKFTDVNGVAQSATTLGKPAQICIPYTDADLNGAFGGPGGLTIWRYDAVAGVWVPLLTTVDPVKKVLCTNSSNFSLFAVGLAPAPAGTATPTATPTPPPAPTATPTPKPPVTGDFSAGSGTLVFVALFGAALVVTGLFAMRRARKTGQQS